MNLGLCQVSSSSLQRIADAVRSGQLRTPLTRNELVAFGVRAQLDALLAVLEGHPRTAVLALLEAVLLERAALTRPGPELVWTGPEGQAATARDTAVVLRELFESARDVVLLGGYSFTHARNVLAPLHASMVARGVRSTFFVDVKQPAVATIPATLHADTALEKFVVDNWPFGPPYPAIYYDKRAIVPPPPHSILHAKCVVVDCERAFISSANFTMQGQERNIEVGVLLEDKHFATQLAQQWMSLIDAKLVDEYLPER
ncbi:MAG TPA: DISARM system phospholipase D-like protein DrmC [Polyangiales bacterium]|nr:DISARM system phospholipase D-like protein DrmC [Polyangiales bacterium]